MNIYEKLADLHKQATSERSHFYVGSVCLEAIEELNRLRSALKTCESLRHDPGCVQVTVMKALKQ